MKFVASGTSAWLDRLPAGGSAGRPRWKEYQQLWQPLKHPWQNQGFPNFAWTVEPVPANRTPGVKPHHYPCRPDTDLAWLDRPWWRPVVRIGEAKNPGPH
eukprot:774356-Amphidinium_carterae.1